MGCDNIIKGVHCNAYRREDHGREVRIELPCCVLDRGEDEDSDDAREKVSEIQLKGYLDLPKQCRW